MNVMKRIYIRFVLIPALSGVFEAAMNLGYLTCRFCVRWQLIFEERTSILLVVCVIERYLSEDASHSIPPGDLMTLQPSWWV